MPVIGLGPQEAGGSPGEGTRAEIKSGLEAEAAEQGGLVAQATQELKARIAQLEQELLLKDGDMAALQRSLELTKEELEGAKAAYAFAVEDYKRLVREHSPLVPPEAVVGGTIEEVKASVNRANDLVAKVRAAIAEQAKGVVVPAGAPPRQEPDLSALSAKEKIAYAVKSRQAK